MPPNMVFIIYGDVEFFWENIYNGNVGLILSISRKEKIRFIDSLKVGWLVNKKNVRSKYTLKNMIPEKTFSL